MGDSTPALLPSGDGFFAVSRPFPASSGSPLSQGGHLWIPQGTSLHVLSGRLFILFRLLSGAPLLGGANPELLLGVETGRCAFGMAVM